MFRSLEASKDVTSFSNKSVIVIYIQQVIVGGKFSLYVLLLRFGLKACHHFRPQLGVTLQYETYNPLQEFLPGSTQYIADFSTLWGLAVLSLDKRCKNAGVMRKASDLFLPS